MTYTLVNDVPVAGYGVVSFSGVNGPMISSLGDVIASMENSSGDIESAIYSPDGNGYPSPLPGPGSSYTYATGINSSDDVVGYDQVASGDNALLWLMSSPGGAPTVLQNLSPIDVDTANAINDNADCAGRADVGSYYQAAYWNSSGDGTLLDALNPGMSSNAWSINDAGDIGGDSSDYAAVWSSDGSIIWNSSIAGSQVVALNNDGDAVGYGARNRAGYLQPVYWSPTGKMTKLADPKSEGAQIYAINASGHSVGQLGTDAVEWSPAGKATILGNLPGDVVNAQAFDLNEKGDAVGVTHIGPTSAETEIATYWTPKGKAMNLQTILGPDWTDTMATGINGAGDISGSGSYNGVQSAFELLYVKGATAETGHYVALDNPTNRIDLAASK